MRRSKSLGEFVPEIERFLHKRKREARHNNAMAAERTLKEYPTPSMEEPKAIIVYPTVEGNNFEIKPALLIFHSSPGVGLISPLTLRKEEEGRRHIYTCFHLLFILILSKL